MGNTPLLYTLMGLLFGSTLLAVGIALGFWMASRNSPNTSELSAKISQEQQNMLAVMRNMANWTNDFAGDFTRYQTQMQSLSKTASDGKSIRTKEEVQSLLDQIVQANNALQSRLDNTEQKLETQTKQIAGYLTEARTDGLTGLANRKAFDQKLDECYAKWQQSKQVFSLAMIDVDHFKKVNDTYGHPAGDAVLREMANRLNEIKSDSLLIARYGGEEFAVLFDGDQSKAAEVMERLRLIIAGKVFEAESHAIAVTISCGVSLVLPDERIGKLVRRSDEALYSAKMGGRNRVVVHTGLVSETFGNPGIGQTVQVNMSPTVEPTVENELEDRVRKQLDDLILQETSAPKV
jgi:diguanylate cyclase